MFLGKRKIIPYDPKLKELAKKLRKQGILAEVLLWNELKSKKLGYDFHRQKPLDKYIVDFYCAELGLIIEIDGSSHNENYKKDIDRQKKLESYGLNLLRFYDGDVRYNIEGVIDSIQGWISEHTPSTPSELPPLSRGE